MPIGWPTCIRSAVIYVISLAHYAIATARGWAANSINARVRLTAENDRLNQEVQLLREGIRIKDARMAWSILAVDIDNRGNYTGWNACLLKVTAENGYSQLCNAFQGACTEQSRGNAD